MRKQNEVKLHWQGKVSLKYCLSLYLLLDDESANWICRTQWISKNLFPNFHLQSLDG